MEQKLAITFGTEELNRWLAARRSVERANLDELVDGYKNHDDTRGLKNQGNPLPPRR
jgi:hypothetical protein